MKYEAQNSWVDKDNIIIWYGTWRSIKKGTSTWEKHSEVAKDKKIIKARYKKWKEYKEMNPPLLNTHSTYQRKWRVYKFND